MLYINWHIFGVLVRQKKLISCSKGTKKVVRITLKNVSWKFLYCGFTSLVLSWHKNSLFSFKKLKPKWILLQWDDFEEYHIPCQKFRIGLPHSSPSPVRKLFIFNLMVSTEASWCNILNLKMYTTLSYIVSLILLNLGHVFRFRFSLTYGWRCESETRVSSSRGLMKQYN